MTKFRVCVDAAEFIDAMWTTPVLDIESSFPDVWRSYDALHSLKRWRRKLIPLAVRPAPVTTSSSPPALFTVDLAAHMLQFVRVYSF